MIEYSVSDSEQDNGIPWFVSDRGFIRILISAACSAPLGERFGPGMMYFPTK